MPKKPKKPPFLDFGREVRKRRRALKISIEELGDRADLSSKYIGTIENGHRDPSLSTMVCIARGLGIAAGELFGNLPAFSAKSIEVGKCFDCVSPELQRAVLLILRGVWMASSPSWVPAR